jgi:hypothetical protein
MFSANSRKRSLLLEDEDAVLDGEELVEDGGVVIIMVGPEDGGR